MKKILITLTTLCLYPLFGYSQILPQNGNIISISSTLPGGEVKACQSILLNPGFSFTASPGDSLILKIDQSICIGFTGTEKKLLTSISPDYNYIVTVTPLDATSNVTISGSQISIADNARALTAVQYFDGLGRPVQTVQRGFGPQGQDLVIALEYDNIGREWKNYLPVPVTGKDGAYIDDVPIRAQSTYNDSKPYSEIAYEASPLNRVLKQFGPGQVWNPNNDGTGGHPVSAGYLTNNNNLQCAFYSISGGNLKKDGNYAPNQLYVTEKMDEDNNKSYEFKDKLGRVVLTRQINDEQNHDTYYVYDDFNNLRFVIPPIAADDLTADNTPWNLNNQTLRDYAYVYTYDARQRCIEKKLPGCDSIYMVYDKADRLILSQDGNQRAKKEWTFNKYDVFGRVIVSGVYSDKKTRSQLEVEFENSLIVETKGGDYGYSWSKMPRVTSDKTLLVNYYDDYEHLLNQKPLFRNSLDYGEVQGYGERYVNGSVSAKGLLVGTRVKTLDNTAEIVTAIYYDDKGRIIQKKSTNIFGGLDYEYYAYDFSGQVTQKQLVHDSEEKDCYGETYRYEYDHAGRPKKTWHKTFSNPEVLMSELVYDNLGRVINKKLHSTDSGNSFLTGITYNFNLRGWLTQIETVSGLDYREYLYYEAPPVPSAAPAYNGNISAITWYTDGNHFFDTYSFTYDGLNQLKKAKLVYNPYNPENYTESFSYDKQGNITFLERGEDPIVNNRLTLNYAGNRLRKVTDAMPLNLTYGNQLFYDGDDIDDEYEYDKNGNLTADYNKRISFIQYNYLNLPQLVQMENHDCVQYIYDAFGMKHRTITKTARPNLVQNTMGELAPVLGSDFIQTVEETYCGDVQYRNTSICKVMTEEGYLKRTGGAYNYVYYIKDHLGNVRGEIGPGGISGNTNYYPSGVETENSSLTEKDRFSGKELEDQHGINLYDFLARRYDPAVMRFTSPDPLAEKYPGVSPYAYCANNPVRFADPTGMEFTDDAWKQVKKLIDDINKRQKSNDNDIAKKQAQIDAGGLSDKKVASLQKDINKLSSNSAELEGVRGEIATLAASNQTYDIMSDNSMNISGPIPGMGEDRSVSKFNFNNGYFEIRLGDNRLGTLAHELKHAYQFETGNLSSGYMRDGTPFYDQTDEWEGYSRGTLFGGQRIYSLPSIYDNLQSGPMDATKLAPIILSNPAELQKLANRTKSAFRINGVTYRMQGGK